MSQQNPTPKKLDWQLMYEGPDLGHLLAYQVFIEPFLSKGSLLNDFSFFKYNYYLWYSDKDETGGIHGGYYVKSDLERAKEHGKKIFFSEKWLSQWYKLIDTDCERVQKLMSKYKFEDRLDKMKLSEIIKLLPKIIMLESRLLSLMRCSQPQLTDPLKDKLYDIIKKRVKDENEVEKIFIDLTLPEEKSVFTHEELAWLNIVIKAKNKIKKTEVDYLTEKFLSENYSNILRLIVCHLKKFKLIPASDRTPAWNSNHFIGLLKTNLKSDVDHYGKKRHIEKQYNNSIQIKKALLKKYKLSNEALKISSKIAKIGFYRFKSGFFWRWMGYYLVLACNKYAKVFNLTYKEISSMTKEELLSALNGKFVVEKDELKRRADAELYLHFEDKDYIWWGDEARQKKQEILGAVDYNKLKELKGEVGNTGIARGTAFVFYWSDDVSKRIQRMPKGSIIVTPQTHPTYMPAIRLAKALVCDEGGVTGHAAIVSRELKKPCVIGLHIATKAINTGDELEVNGNTGVVKILKRKKNKTRHF